MSDDSTSDSPDGIETEEDARVSRREALKKAAAGAATMGAVWAGPRVEGLSLVPDYASAGTVHGLSKAFVISNASSDGPFSVDSDNGGAGTGCDPYGGIIYGNDWAAVAPASNPGITVAPAAPNARNTTINMVYPVPATNTLNPGPAGNITAVIPSGFEADMGNANNTVTMQFRLNETNNKCRVTSATVLKCDGTFGTATLNNNPGAGVLNSPASFDVGVTVAAPQPGNLQTLTITVNCT